MGRIQVGPHSAGSEPGPVAFGKGGALPTTTDADVAQGLIVEGRFAEGCFRINRANPEASLLAKVGQPLDLAADIAALCSSEIVTERMAGAGRLYAAEFGKTWVPG